MENLMNEEVLVETNDTKETVEKKGKNEMETKIYNMLGHFMAQGVTEENLENILEIVKKDNPTIKLLYTGGLFVNNLETHCYTYAWIEDGEIKNLNARVEKFN